MTFINSSKKSMSLILVLFSSISFANGFNFLEGVEPRAEYGFAEYKGKKIFLACTKKSGQCKEYKFFKRTAEGELKISDKKHSKESLENIMNDKKNLGEILNTKISNPDFVLYILPTTTLSVSFLAYKKALIATPFTLIVSAPFDLAISPLTAIAFGISHLDRLVKKSQVKNALEIMTGVKNKKSVKMSKDSIKYLYRVVNSL